mmetsp:Transcript_76689/g.153900  ORF Transcript_76689/g.153900 Transcript_76689/m.153900 type:complete len:207 (+) Transcript_76689:191-811(+)
MFAPAASSTEQWSWGRSAIGKGTTVTSKPALEAALRTSSCVTPALTRCTNNATPFGERSPFIVPKRRGGRCFLYITSAARMTENPPSGIMSVLKDSQSPQRSRATTMPESFDAQSMLLSARLSTASSVDVASPSVMKIRLAPRRFATILARPEPAPSSSTAPPRRFTGDCGDARTRESSKEPGHTLRPDISAFSCSRRAKSSRGKH